MYLTKVFSTNPLRNPNRLLSKLLSQIYQYLGLDPSIYSVFFLCVCVCHQFAKWRIPFHLFKLRQIVLFVCLIFNKVMDKFLKSNHKKKFAVIIKAKIRLKSKRADFCDKIIGPKISVK